MELSRVYHVNVPKMYPHQIDRLRLLQFIFRRLQRASATQEELEQRTGVKQPNIAKLCHLVDDDGTISGVTRNSRSYLLKVASLGFELPQAELDALAWLLDKKVMAPPEVRSFVGPGVTTPDYGNTDKPLSEAVLNLLARAVEPANEDARVKMYLRVKGLDSAARQAELKLFLDYELQPGQRLFVSSLPSSLAHPDEAFDSGALLPPYIQEAQNREALITLYRERRAAFLHNLAVYGERSIHSKATLQRYVRASDGHHMATPRRRGQIENCIRLLEEHDDYQIGLTDDESLLELGLKLTPAAVIRGFSPNRSRDKAPLWGIHHILWTDAESVFAFVLTFEHAWLNIRDQDRDKGTVISFLRDLLK
jgi:hypothetical protein